MNFFIVSKEYCIARHNDNMRFLPNRRDHILLIGNIKELLQNLDAFCLHYQHNCTHCWSTASVAKLLSRVDNSLIMRRRQFNSATRTEDWTDCQHREKEMKKYKKHLFSSFQNIKPTQTSRSVLADRIEQVEKIYFEL